MTNGERIRLLPDEDLVKILSDPVTYGFNCEMCSARPQYGTCINGNCKGAMLEWLKTESIEK